jgi:hypothetical protein
LLPDHSRPAFFPTAGSPANAAGAGRSGEAAVAPRRR